MDRIPKFLMMPAIFGFLVLAMFGQTRLPEVDLKVNGIGSGTSYSAIVKNLGKPLRSRNRGIDECGEGGILKYLFFPGLTIEVLSDAKGRNFKVVSIEVRSRKWSIAPGLTIGSKKQVVRSTYGTPLKNDPGENKLRYVTKDNLGWVTFEFEGNKLVKISMYETLC